MLTITSWNPRGGGIGFAADEILGYASQLTLLTFMSQRES
jgi:hypothetical protein